MRTRPLFEGAGFGLLYVFPFAATFLSPSLGDAYNSLHPITSIHRALLIVAVCLSLAAWPCFAAAQRLSGWSRSIAELVPIVVLPWLVCRAFAAIYWHNVGAVALRAARILPAVTLLVGVGLLIYRRDLYNRCSAWCRASYAIAALGMLVVLPQLVYHAFGSHKQEQAAFIRPGLPPVAPSESRIVWILFDELDYNQAFAARQPDLALPHFDDLAKSSVIFSSVRPFATATEELVPGLLLGRPVVALRTPYGKQPSYRTAAKGSWDLFNQYDTIFAQAHALGWTTGVAGWYNPYCRLLPDVLDRCFWQFSEQPRNALSASLKTTNSISENLLAILPFRPLVDAFFDEPAPGRSQVHRMDYTGVMNQAEELLRDSRIRFVFLHLPVPHPPGIYDRAHQTLSDKGTYLDNLALADESLGALQKIVQSTPAAANTTLIVSSDHAWRTFMWKGTPDWSQENERASGGKFDSRPVLAVQLPGGSTGTTVARPTNELAVHAIIDAILRSDVHSPADVVAIAAEDPLTGNRLKRGD